MAGIIGRKVGMTRLFDEAGTSVPVTVVEAGPCPVVRVRTAEEDGYDAVQLGFGAQKAKRASRAEVGHAAAAGIDYAPRVLREFPVSEGEDFALGQEVTVERFRAGSKVRVVGESKGRGFQGVVKRHGFAGRPGGHGHPMSRNPGSIGAGTDPSRVIKGKKLPGRMGGARTTLVNQEIVRVDRERNLLFIKGAVPGARSGYVLIIGK